ncbi:MAG: hypothetical protein K0S41_2860 [Anaerocolumna sp.]|jgi:hypothetical protein|nr:hypothetical protein [Anaerocolumna sp.]
MVFKKSDIGLYDALVKQAEIENTNSQDLAKRMRYNILNK